jgi:hypothetical protein
MRHMHSIMERMHFGYGPPTCLRNAMAEAEPMAARFPYMSSALPGCRDLAARQPKLQDRQQVQTDLNQQALNSRGLSANPIAKCPVDPETDHTRREQAKRSATGRLNFDYVAASLQSNQAIACANQFPPRRPEWISQQRIGSLAEKRWSRVHTDSHRCPALPVEPRAA